MKLHIDYTESGKDYSDFKIVDIVNQCIDYIKVTGLDLHIKSTNELMIHAARVAIKEGKIPTDSIAFYFNGELVNHDKNGEFEKYPERFLEIKTQLLMKLI